ncbi:uncharacterized protein PITG_12044 [Phytophthora infestans T30-4]|uniref:Uncharacterized protein n=1 Tax=Phytophthora infestans (strain T30-4) TaxID=403677 RepID=D0NHS7_PHYIT|nr:uncharacterized protein PITG_12044 [Phytophthora infestans T30-4]EEY59002.1 hypothetical protein PITG_12044 [Phytophthora infestans T30-4]|eukprot:XP_002901475.1 hypothetical protein PITG_12044 [Phytophthora infestans T30-4]
MVEYVRDGREVREAPPSVVQLGHGMLVEQGMQHYLLRRGEHERVKMLINDFTVFEAATKTKQKSTLTSAVRRLFG